LSVSILLLLDVAGKRIERIFKIKNPLPFQSFFFWMWLENSGSLFDVLRHCAGFNPSSSGCGWKTQLSGIGFIMSMNVSILLLLDVAGKPALIIGQQKDEYSFNPSSSGCGWKTLFAET